MITIAGGIVLAVVALFVLWCAAGPIIGILAAILLNCRAIPAKSEPFWQWGEPGPILLVLAGLFLIGVLVEALL